MNESNFEANIEGNGTEHDENNATQDEFDIPSEYEERSSTNNRKKSQPKSKQIIWSEDRLQLMVHAVSVHKAHLSEKKLPKKSKKEQPKTLKEKWRNVASDLSNRPEFKEYLPLQEDTISRRWGRFKDEVMREMALENDATNLSNRPEEISHVKNVVKELIDESIAHEEASKFLENQEKRTIREMEYLEDDVIFRSFNSPQPSSTDDNQSSRSGHKRQKIYDYRNSIYTSLRDSLRDLIQLEVFPSNDIANFYSEDIL